MQAAGVVCPLGPATTAADEASLVRRRRPDVRDDLAIRLDAGRAGGIGFFATPTDGDALAAALKQLVQSGRDPPNRILVVDDVAVEAMVSAQVLRKAGFEVQELTDELKIIDSLHEFHPDLILMDLNMPNATGAELTTIIRDQDEDLLTPIVFLSGERDADVQRQILRLGADEFLTKPLDPGLLIESRRRCRAQCLCTATKTRVIRSCDRTRTHRAPPQRQHRHLVLQRSAQRRNFAHLPQRNRLLDCAR